MTKPSYEELERQNAYLAGELSKRDKGLFKKRHQIRDLEDELERVRGLLRRMYELVRDGVLVRNVDEDDVFGDYVKQVFRLTATLREVEIAIADVRDSRITNAESADMGKPDRVDKSGVEMGKVNKFDAVSTDEEAKQMLDARFAGSAETGGEKAAPDYENDPAHKQCVGFSDWNALLYEISKFYAKIDPEWADADIDQMDEFDPWEALRRLQANFPSSSQNQTVSSGVDGAHEGNTADKNHQHVCKFYDPHYGQHQCVCGLRSTMPMSADDKCAREPEKLNNAQNTDLKPLLYEAVLLVRGGGTRGECETFLRKADKALAESSLSVPQAAGVINVEGEEL